MPYLLSASLPYSRAKANTFHSSLSDFLQFSLSFSPPCILRELSSTRIWEFYQRQIGYIIGILSTLPRHIIRTEDVLCVKNVGAAITRERLAAELAQPKFYFEVSEEITIEISTPRP